MRIGIIVDNEFNNDIRVRNEALALKDAGHEIFILCFEAGSNFGNKYEGIKIKRWKLASKYKNILFALFHSFNAYTFLWSGKIKKFIKEEQIDIIHVHDLYMSRAGHYGRKKAGIPMVLDLHENYAYAVDGYEWMHKPISTKIIKPSRWKEIEGRYLSYADTIITISETFKQYLLNKYSNLKAKNIISYPNAPDVSTLMDYDINNNIIEKNNDFVLFYFGVISKRRGVFLAIEALKQIKTTIPNIKLLLIGPVDKSENAAFTNLINEVDIKNNIIHYAWKDISLLPSFITYSDICISPIEKNPQHESGIANKVFQYMLFERSVLVSDCGPQQEVIDKSDCGLVHKWDSVKDFTDKVLFLYNNPSITAKMGENGRAAVLNKYNQSELIKPLLGFYNHNKSFNK